MYLKFRLPLAIFATLALAVCTMRAQEDDEDEEEFGTMGFFGRSPQELNVSLKLTQGPKVKFGNLGNLPDVLPPPAVGVIGRQYMDGAVSGDSRRPYSVGDPTSEFTSDGFAVSTSGGRYQVYDARDSAILRGDYKSYTPGVTRNWTYTNESQATSHPGYVAMNIYSANTQGATLLGSRGYTGGVELSIARNLTDPGKRLSFSIVAGLSLTGINSSKTGQVNSSLHTYTDLYSLNGEAAPFTPFDSEASKPAVRYTGPSFTNVNGVDTEGTGVPNTAITVANLPDKTEETDEPDKAVVKGIWKLRGAYFTLKVGPQVTAMLTRKLGLSASMGLAGSYVGTTYSANESFEVDGFVNPVARTDPEETSTKSTFLSGYYANIDASWELNERTGFFAGVSYDNLGDYSQSVGGRSAKIDLGSTAGVRGGLSIKF